MKNLMITLPNWIRVLSLSTLSLLIGWGVSGLVMAANLPTADISCPANMVPITGGTFIIGSNDHYAAEHAAADVTVDGFCIDRHEVTNAEFRQFVEATDYQTIAERPLSATEYPELTDVERAPGSLVFQPPEGDLEVEQVPYLSWWHWVPGANWQHPYGPDSDTADRDDYPVVHIAYDDAIAYAEWSGKSLPTEAQWEYAARGGLDGKAFTWGNQYSAQKANTWQGMFPFFNTKDDGYIGTAPVESFPPNDYGLYDMTGNVWELTSDWYSIGHFGKAHSHNPSGPSQARSIDPTKPNDGALHVIKGGSYLCAKNYCSRYRPAARESQAPDTGTTHVGFRLVSDFQ